MSRMYKGQKKGGIDGEERGKKDERDIRHTGVGRERWGNKFSMTSKAYN